jgi:hypothetical protein
VVYSSRGTVNESHGMKALARRVDPIIEIGMFRRVRPPITLPYRSFQSFVASFDALHSFLPRTMTPCLYSGITG